MLVSTWFDVKIQLAKCYTDTVNTIAALQSYIEMDAYNISSMHCEFVYSNDMLASLSVCRTVYTFSMSYRLHFQYVLQHLSDSISVVVSGSYCSRKWTLYMYKLRTRATYV